MFEDGAMIPPMEPLSEERKATSGAAGDDDAVLAQHLSDIARVLLAPGSVSETLRGIVRLAVLSIDGCDEAGMHLPGDATEGMSSGPVVAELDRAQAEHGEGPCLEVLAGLNTLYAADLALEDRWPGFAPSAVAAGVRSVLVYRLSSGDDTLGALQLYARLPGAFSARDRAQGLIFAAHAAMALAVAQAQEVERGKMANLEAAMVSREIIGQAQGILMERERITAEQAFELLRRASQHLNLKLRDVAQELVDTGATPATPTTPT